MRVTYMISLNHDVPAQSITTLHAYKYAANPRNPAQTRTFPRNATQKFGLMGSQGSDGARSGDISFSDTLVEVDFAACPNGPSACFFTVKSKRPAGAQSSLPSPRSDSCRGRRQHRSREGRQHERPDAQRAIGDRAGHAARDHPDPQQKVRP